MHLEWSTKVYNKAGEDTLYKIWNEKRLVPQKPSGGGGVCLSRQVEWLVQAELTWEGESWREFKKRQKLSSTG